MWPSKQYYYTKYLPISANQHEWPDISIVENYIEDFGEHNCDKCIADEAPWKRTVCDNGVSTSYRGSQVKVCTHNLIEFGTLQWWEKNKLD